jgi:hypothetical protein
MPKASSSRKPKAKSKSNKRTATKTAQRSSVTPGAATALALPQYPKTAEQADQTPPRQLPPAWEIARAAGQLIWDHRKTLGGVIGVYALLNLVLVQGLVNGVNVASLKGQVAQSLGGHPGQVVSGLAVFAYMVGSAGGSLNSGGGAYGLFLVVIASLAFVWALKQALDGVAFQIREAYYRSMHPLIPVVLVLLIVGVQLLPALLGATLYNLLVNNSIVIGPIEIGIVALIFAGSVFATLYMLSASVPALYIVATTPDMTPRTALQLGRQLVRGRRWPMVRKLLFLPVVLFLAGGVIMVPFIALAAPLAPWAFFVVSVLALAALHGYLYTLYRELANESIE